MFTTVTYSLRIITAMRKTTRGVSDVMIPTVDTEYAVMALYNKNVATLFYSVLNASAGICVLSIFSIMILLRFMLNIDPRMMHEIIDLTKVI